MRIAQEARGWFVHSNGTPICVANTTFFDTREGAEAARRVLLADSEPTARDEFAVRDRVQVRIEVPDGEEDAVRVEGLGRQE